MEAAIGQRLPDGRRMHFWQGPIDLVVECTGSADAVAAAYDSGFARFRTILEELCAELPLLRAAAGPATPAPAGAVARRMTRAVGPHAAGGFITPMAAVAGAVAEEVLDALLAHGGIAKAYVNNGGDIALHLGPGHHYALGIVDRPEAPRLAATARIAAGSGIGGIATSGWRGRSFSLGIADAVTVLAGSASAADAAATIIANAVDLPGHAAISRVPACSRQADSDLGERLVTVGVGRLDTADIDWALASGRACAQSLVAARRIDAAALFLEGRVATVGLDGLAFGAPTAPAAPRRTCAAAA